MGGGATAGRYNYCFQPEPDEGEGAERGRPSAVGTSLTTENPEAVHPVRTLRAAPLAPRCPPRHLVLTSAHLGKPSSEGVML